MEVPMAGERDSLPELCGRLDRAAVEAFRAPDDLEAARAKRLMIGAVAAIDAWTLEHFQAKANMVVQLTKLEHLGDPHDPNAKPFELTKLDEIMAAAPIVLSISATCLRS